MDQNILHALDDAKLAIEAALARYTAGDTQGTLNASANAIRCAASAIDMLTKSDAEPAPVPQPPQP